MFLQVFRREVGRTDLLRDTTSFIGLNVSFTQFIKDQSLSGIDVTHDADNWATQPSCLSLVLAPLALLEELELTSSASCGSIATLHVIKSCATGGSSVFCLLL